MKRRADALTLLAGLFALGGVMKAGELSAQVAPKEPAPAAVSVETPPRKEAKVEQADPEAAEPAKPLNLQDVAASCGDKGALGRALARRAQELDAREAEIVMAEDALSRQGAEMEAERQALDAMRGETDEMASARHARLVRLYEAMKPKKAAQIFDQMDVEVAATILARMREEQASFVLSSMDPRRAYALTVLLGEIGASDAEMVR